MLNFLNKKIFYNKKKIYFIIFLFCFLFLFYYEKKKITLESKENKKNFLSFIQYEKVIKKINIQEPKTVIKAIDFIEKNKNIYGALTAMSLAKKYVLYNQYGEAIKELKQASKYIKEENFQNLLLLRISKIQVEQDNHKEAIKTLQKINKDNWINIIENTKGDIFFKIHHNKEAIRSWKNSQKKENSYAFKKIIKIKIENLQEK